jgi:ABC-2 type transport system ATP-binding protein
MSKGMKQRLQLARTLLHDPKVLILDEPASDLDPRARIEIRDLLVELRSMGKTIFLSSHILTELADVCTSVAILERGRLVVAGPIADIARRLEEAALEQRAQVPQVVVPPAVPLQHASNVTIDVPAGGYRQSEIEPAPQTVTVPRRRLKIRAPCELGAIQGALAGLPNVYGVAQITGGLFLVTYTGDDQVIASIVRALVMAAIAVMGVEPERSELERIFLEVTKGEVQ